MARIATAQPNRVRRRTVPARNRSRCPTSATASQLVGETSPSRGARGRHERPPRPPSRSAATVATRDPPRRTSTSPQAWIASSRRWVETRTQAPRARASRDHVEGRLDADRVDAVERLVEQQHLGARACAASSTDSRRPMPCEKPPAAPVRGVAELEPLEQVAGAGLPVAQPAQPRRQLEVLPRGRARAPGRRRRGSSPTARLASSGVGADVVARDADDSRGRGHDAGQDPHRGRLAGAVAAEQPGRASGVRREVDARDRLHVPEPDVEVAHLDDGPGLVHPNMIPQEPHPSPVPATRDRGNADGVHVHGHRGGTRWNAEGSSGVVPPDRRSKEIRDGREGNARPRA